MHDGNELFSQVCAELGVPVMHLVARTARWVDPAVFRALPVWHPAFHRKMPLFQADWQTPQLLRKIDRAVETNFKAQETLDAALGIAPESRKNWTCCHVWGYSDETFQSASPTNDPRFYTCVANMVQLPTPLKALTDSLPRVQAALRTCAWHLYGWTPPVDEFAEAAAIRAGHVPEDYPEFWPLPGRPARPPLLHAATDRVMGAVARRRAKLGREIAEARAGRLGQYPLDSVRSVLDHWGLAQEFFGP